MTRDIHLRRTLKLLKYILLFPNPFLDKQFTTECRTGSYLQLYVT